jgi:outer membrane protein TolC
VVAVRATARQPEGHASTPAAPIDPGPALFAAPSQAEVFTPPPTDPGLRPLPIDLPTALRLANTRAIDIDAAAARLRVASAQLNQANVLWLPAVTFGGDYFRHDGRIQNSDGVVTNRDFGSAQLGLGSGPGVTAIISFNDAYFAPLAARQVVRARQADLQTANNDSMLATTEAYFNAEQARGELAGALDASRRTEELVRRTDQLAAGLVAPVEAIRARAELARRRQAELLARERWRVASAELLRVLRLDPGTQVEPVEPPHLRVDLVRLDLPVDDLIPIGLTLRPELASQQALVQSALQLLRQERMRPLVPSLLLRGASTNPTGTFGASVFGGGQNDSINNFGPRLDADVQLYWQLDNLGFGNRARIRQRNAEREQALVELFRIQDRVAAEISQAYAQAQLAAERVGLAEQGLRLSVDSAEKNLAGVGQTRRSGDLIVLVIRPQEAVASVQALAVAYLDYYGAIADANRAQFRLYRALGNPAQLLTGNPAGTRCANNSLVPTALAPLRTISASGSSPGSTKETAPLPRPASP